VAKIQQAGTAEKVVPAGLRCDHRHGAVLNTAKVEAGARWPVFGSLGGNPGLAVIIGAVHGRGQAGIIGVRHQT